MVAMQGFRFGGFRDMLNVQDFGPGGLQRAEQRVTKGHFVQRDQLGPAGRVDTGWHCRGRRCSHHRDLPCLTPAEPPEHQVLYARF